MEQCCTAPAASTSSTPFINPAFHRWQSRCHSAMQPSPYRTTTPRAKPLDAYFPVRSATASSSNLTAGGSGSSSTVTSDTSSSKTWGWLRGGKKDDVATEASSALPGNNSQDALSDLYAQLQPEQESSTDRGQREMCEGYLDKLLRGSPMVRFMVKQLSIVGCSPVGKEGGMDRIVLGKCQPGIAGGFMPSPEGAPRSQSGLLICYNGIIDKKHMENTMAHEMLHWFDHCRFKANWNDLRHVACSEIRAASLSGDCKFMREVSRGQFGFRKQHQVCVRRRAVISVEANPECPDKETAERMVDEVWESCFSDTRPFDEIY